MRDMRPNHSAIVVALVAVVCSVGACSANDVTAEPVASAVMTGRVALPAPPVSDGPASPCATTELDFVVEAFDGAMGNSWAQLRAMNHTDRPCVLDGFPEVNIDQAGHRLQLTVDHASVFLYGPAVPSQIRLEPQSSATAELFWRGYRDAADHTTAQVARVALADGSSEPAVMGTYTPTAPFDLVDGGTITVGPWVAVGYGAPWYDWPHTLVLSTQRCLAGDLVATVTGPHSDAPYPEDEQPTAELMVANVGLEPCVVAGDLALDGPNGQYLAAPNKAGEPDQQWVLRPTDGLSGTLPWVAVEPMLSDPDRWTVVCSGDQRVPITLRYDGSNTGN